MPAQLTVSPFCVCPDSVGCVDPEECVRVCGAQVGCSNIAYPKLVIELLPSGELIQKGSVWLGGLRGLMIAVMMAALMSSLTSIFNSSSTLFTMDIWKRFRREASERDLLLVGRVVTVILVAVSVVWIPILQSSNSGQLFIYIQSVTSCLAPPVTAVFLLAVFWRRANEQGAFWSLMLGLAVGLSRMALEFAHPAPPCGAQDWRPSLVKDVHYLHFAVVLCLLTAAAMVGLSLLTSPPAESQIKGVTWWTSSLERWPSPPPLSAPKSLSGRDVSGAEKYESRDELPQSCFCNGVPCGPPSLGAGRAPAEDPGDRTESPFWARVCGINAIILLCVNVFFYAYFA
ncbi:hypothetical protein lerEdw1_004552 [Lerista edwardsae]|nr:hypothetical protein lerEdw1_004552 [Lerista edwardsae]